MVNISENETEKVKSELSRLRQAIMKVEPNVLLDGRFEQMIVNPISIIDIACDLLKQQPGQHQTGWMTEVE